MLRFLAPTERLAALKIDLDNFKHVNEALGHSVGDEALRLYCSIVRRILFSVGEVYRRGGDEIVAFAPGLDAAAAQTFAEEIRGAVEVEFRRWGKDRGLTSFPTASIGLVVSDKTRPFSEIVQMMDDAQRQAKQLGKNRVVFLQIAVPATPRAE